MKSWNVYYYQEWVLKRVYLAAPDLTSLLVKLASKQIEENEVFRIELVAELNS